MGAALTLVAVAIAIEAHRRGRAPDARTVHRALLAFAGGLLVAIAAWFAIPGGGVPPALPVAAQAIGGLVAWVGLMRLIACDARRRDFVVRGILGAIALLVAASAGSPQLTAFITVLAVLSFRWKRVFPTRPRFWLALGFLVLFLLGLRVPAPSEPESGMAAAAIGFGRWSAGVAIVYSLFGALALFRAFIRDPSLGIQMVGRRLALSHVLVAAVPLLLLGLLWTFTTVLGVNSDRAMVAGRAIETEGRALAAVLREVLAAGAGAPEVARGRLAGHGSTWSDGRLWLGERGAWRRVAGDSIAGEARIAAWPDSLGRFPQAAVVDLGGRRFYGAAARDPADSSRAAVVLVDTESLLAGEPARVAAAKLLVTTRGSLGTRNVDVVRDAAERTREAEQARALGTRPAEPQQSDSARLARARRVLRGLGLSDTLVSASPRRGGLRLTTAGDTLDLRTFSPSGNPMLDGHALLPAIAWSGERMRPARALLTSNVDARVALAGLYRNLRDNPVSLLPVILIAALSLLVVLVVVFDVAMVTGMARSITAAIHALKGGAAQLEANQLSHRIEVQGDDDLWDVAGAFNQAMAGFERSRELEQERARLENELALARQIQARLLPAGPPKIAGFEIAGHYDPARQVGGDYYDHLEIGPGRVLLVIADVSGKGVPASLLMSGFRASLMSQDLSVRDPIALCGHLNDFLVRSVETGKFVTSFLAFADAGEGTLHFVNAGHNPPLLLRADGSHLSLEEGGLMFGVLPGAPYASARVPFGAGDLLVLYTDGVVEGASPSQELWGDERLLEAVRRGAAQPCGRLVETIAGEVRAFEGDAGPADDVTLLVARRV